MTGSQSDRSSLTDLHTPMSGVFMGQFFNQPTTGCDLSFFVKTVKPRHAMGLPFWITKLCSESRCLSAKELTLAGTAGTPVACKDLTPPSPAPAVAPDTGGAAISWKPKLGSGSGFSRGKMRSSVNTSASKHACGSNKKGKGGLRWTKIGSKCVVEVYCIENRSSKPFFKTLHPVYTKVREGRNASERPSSSRHAHAYMPGTYLKDALIL